LGDPLLNDRNALHTFSGHTLPITELKFSHSLSSSARLFSSSLDQSIRVHDIISGNCIKVFLYETPVKAFAFGALDQVLFAGGDDAVVYATKLLPSYSPVDETSMSSSAMNDSKMSGMIKGCSSVNNTSTGVISNHRRFAVVSDIGSTTRTNLCSLAITPSNSRVLVGTEAGNVHCFDFVSGSLVRSISHHKSAVTVLHSFVMGNTGLRENSSNILKKPIEAPLLARFKSKPEELMLDPNYGDYEHTLTNLDPFLAFENAVARTEEDHTITSQLRHDLEASREENQMLRVQLSKAMRLNDGMWKHLMEEDLKKHSA
jgi:WD40 repeat protein